MSDTRDPSPSTPAPRPSRRETLAAGAAGAATLLFGFSRPVRAQDDASGRVVQTARFKLAADKTEEGLEALRQLTRAVEEKEPGVLIYYAHQSKNDPTDLFFYEVYADQEALAAHGQTEHIGALRGLFASGVLQPPVEIVGMDPVGGFHR